MIESAQNDKSPKTLTDLVYNQIREDIISGKHEPETKLRIEQLKKEYNVGSTQIREALSRLSSDGFVVTEGRAGLPVDKRNLTVPVQGDQQNLREIEVLLNSVPFPTQR